MLQELKGAECGRTHARAGLLNVLPLASIAMCFLKSRPQVSVRWSLVSRRKVSEECQLPKTSDTLKQIILKALSTFQHELRASSKGCIHLTSGLDLRRQAGAVSNLVSIVFRDLFRLDWHFC